MSPVHVVLAGGGTAGHVEPALNLADCLRRHDPDVGITALGTERGLETRLVPERGYDLRLVTATPMPRRPTLDLARLPTRVRRAVAEVREVPGHNPGSVIFYVETLALAFVGDAIFRGSIGRTDLPGGDHPRLLQSIREQIFSLPDETILLPGHGPESSVGFEKRNNPYLA